MNGYKSAAFAAAVMLGLVGQAGAQDAMAGHDMAAMGQSALPEICGAGGGGGAAGTTGSMEHPMDDAHAALMEGMDAMNRDMMVGGTAPDIDVAFVCAMIPHHQGAISMARAELEHGDDPWVKELAQKVITAQEQEIAEMVAWLEKQG